MSADTPDTPDTADTPETPANLNDDRRSPPSEPAPVGDAPQDRPHIERRARRANDRRRDHDSAQRYPASLDRRRGPGRRLSDFARAADEGELTPEQFLFVSALHRFKQANGGVFPAWTEVLEVIRLLGYRKVQPSSIDLRNAEDFTEKPGAPANVRLNEAPPEDPANPDAEAA